MRQSSLPGDIRLPKRYETAGDMSPKRRSLITDNANESLGDRLDDLAQAMIWVKNELVSPLSDMIGLTFILS